VFEVEYDKTTTIKLSLGTRSELIRVKGELEVERGQKVTYDQAIQELITFWKQSHR
jgi:hypothetical protein